MTEREALRLAQEALEAHADIGIKSDKAITAIKEALAQPKQCRHRIADARNKVVKDGYICVDCGALFSAADHNEAQPKQDWIERERAVGYREGHMAALSQRTWVGLTDEEIKDCFKITPDQHLPWHIYQRIEAKLKEKNNG